MLILVAGLPGSGKSSFAERLARQIGAVHLNSDRVRAQMNARGKYSYENWLAMYKEMAKEASALVGKGKDVVVDGTFFHHTLRELFVALAGTHHVPIHVIEVVADEAVIKDRLHNAREFSEPDFGVYEKIRDEYEEITMPHLILSSTNYNTEEMLSSAMKYVGI